MQDRLSRLKELKKQKRSKLFYSQKLGVTMREVEDLLKRIKEGEETEKEEEESVGIQAVAENFDSGTKEVKFLHTREALSEAEIWEECKLDPLKWNLAQIYHKKYGLGFLYTANFRAKNLDNSLESQKEFLLQELKQQLEPTAPYLGVNAAGEYAYEISIPDIHFGKMSWGEETGEDYDLKIAEQRFTTAVEELFSLINVEKLDRIIFPIGNDMINIDSRKNETFAGTRQDSDSRFFKIVRTVKGILIRTINSLQLVAPVDVIIVPGNHDPEAMFMIGEMLDAYYHNNLNVNIDNGPKTRKYYQYGLNSFQYTHGNEEAHKDLGLIFATEEPQLWADTKYRVCKLGHYHKNKKLDFVSVDEHQGFQVQILPSLSSNDAWHSSKGYNSLRQAKGFLYHKTKGLIAEYTYTI